MRANFYFTAFLALSLAAPRAGADGQIVAYQRIDDTTGGLGAVLDDEDEFGAAVARIGDLDGDGNGDLAVGAPGDSDVAADAGAVWILFLNDDGTVRDSEKLDAANASIPGLGDPGTRFGRSVAHVDDIDGDGTNDLAVGGEGLAWVVFLEPDGTASSGVVIGAGLGGFTGAAAATFGTALCGLGDLDEDGVRDIAVGDPEYDDALVPNSGAVWILFLNADGTVRDHALVSFGSNFPLIIPVASGDRFGAAVARIGDINGDGVDDLAVGAPDDDSSVSDTGAVWVLLVNRDGTIETRTELSNYTGGTQATLEAEDHFGSALSWIGNLDGVEAPDLLIGSPGQLSLDTGRVWLTFLEVYGPGHARSQLRYADGQLGFPSGIDDDDEFGVSVSFIGDLDDDGEKDFVVGAPGSSAGGWRRGAVYVLFHAGVTPASAPITGCGVNPAGSLVVEGLPILDSTMTLGVDNPLGSQMPGAVGFLMLSVLPPSLGPLGCGLAAPGMNQDPAVPFGEFLLGVPVIKPLLFGSAPWAGPGSPVEFELAIPQVPEFMGFSIWAQGGLFDPTPGTPTIGLTRGVQLRLGT